jgi:hypothetical protein
MAQRNDVSVAAGLAAANGAGRVSLQHEYSERCTR